MTSQHGSRGYTLPKPNGSGFKLDLRQVDRNLENLTKFVNDAAREGLTAAGTMLMNDTVQDIPTTPVDTSELRGSGGVFVSGRRVAVSQHGITNSQPGPGASSRREDQLVAEVIFNAPHALIQHEAFPTKKEPGAGMKYLEKKVFGNARAYFKAISDVVGRKIGKYRTIA